MQSIDLFRGHFKMQMSEMSLVEHT